MYPSIWKRFFSLALLLLGVSCGRAFAQGLPSGWSDGDVGSVGVAGSASYAGNVFTVKGSGLGGMSGTSDSFNFSYQSLSGDGTIIARLASLQGSTSAQAGVTIRETLNANATNAFTVFQSSYTYFYDRTSTGGNEGSLGYVYHALPYWMKLVRSGSSFSSYTSLDGINWTQVATSQTITMASSVYIGLVVSNQSNSSLATATFDNVSISSTASPAPAITSLSSTTGPVGSQFTIFGSGFGSSQGSSAVMLNNAAVTVNSWASGQISVTVPTGATSGDVVVSVAPSMNDSNPVEFTVESNALPSGWVDEDLGAVGVMGSASSSGGTFTVKGSGTGATSGTSDSFHFVYQTLSGDGTLVARVVSCSGGEAGVMIRETLNTNATNAYPTYKSSYNYFYARTTTGGTESYSNYVYNTLPYWLKVVRSGSTFSSYGSPDGVNWTQIGTNQTITMAQNVYIGLVASSESNSSLATATFDSVSLGSSASPAPAITSISPAAGTAGSQAVISGSGFGATQGNSVVLMNGSAITANSWSATSITVTVPTSATTGPILVSVAPSMNDSNAVLFYVATQTISSSSWLDLDVGTVGVAGSASYANGVFTVKGSGLGVGGTADNMNFLFLPFSGDGTIVARVASLQGTTSAEAGVMIRETLSAGATNTFNCSCGNTVFSYDRATTGGQETNLGNNGSGIPYWVKLVRAGNTFTFYTSANGLVWSQVTSQTVTMAQNVYAGLAVSNYNNSSLATATFDYVSISSSAAPAPVITALSATTGSVGTQVGIEGSGFGSSQGNSFVSLNGLAMTVNNWSDSEITITIPSGATTGLLVVSVAPNMNGSNALPFEVTTQPLPLTWQDQDINQAGHTATYSGAQFVMTSGNGTVTGTADTFHFIYQPLAGDGTIVARIAYYQWNYSQVGVMIRETLSPGSKHAFVYFAPNTASFVYRSSTGGSTTTQSTSFSNPSGYYPYWAKLTRSGNSFTAYVSADNVYWTQVGTTQTITMAQDLYIGLAAASVASVNFDNVSVSSATTAAPVITGLSTSTASIGSQVVITGSGFGATQNGSAVLLSDNPVPIVSWSDTSITFTVPAGAVSGQLGVSVAPSMNDSNAVYLEVTPLPLPTSWRDQDISSVGVGSATYSPSSGIFTVKGAGAAIGGTADTFHFADQPLSGDGTFIARLISYKSNTTPQIGAMIRETLDPGAKDVFVTFQPNTASLYYRTTAGGSSSTQSTSFGNPAGYYPYWMKITRSGNTFSGYVSSDGVTWTQVGTTQTITMAQNVYVGLAVTLTTTALFDNVSLSTTAALAPIITNVSATTGAIGSQIVITGSHFGSSQGSSAVMLSDAPMTVNSWSDTSITITITPTAITGYLTVLVAPTMNASNPVVFTVTSQPLPSGWLDTDIGTVGTAGSATYSNGTFTLKAQGSGVDGGNNSGSLTADGFHFAYQSVSGDAAIVARISNIQGENPGILAGVMIRQTLDPGAVNAFVWYYWSNATFGFRTSSGASATMQTTGVNFSVNFFPYWAKLARIGNTFRAYISQDGQNWTQVGTTQTITMATTVDFGLALCNCSALNAATFDNVSITNATMPLITGITPTYGTIGTSVTINGSSFGATQGSSTVSFNGALASSVTSWSDTQIVAVVPTNASTGGVSVVVNGIESNTDVGFTFYHPVISSVSPSTGQVGANVVITGTGFGQYYQTGFQVLINGSPATILGIGYGVLAWSDTSITVVVYPNNTSGPLVVSLQGIASNAVQFNVENLTVTGVSPSSGPVGSQVTITGTGFGSPQSTSALGFYGAPGTSIVSWSDTAIVATVPQGTTTGPVNVTVGGILKFGPSFTVTGTTQVTDSLGNTSSYTSAYVGGSWVMTQGQGSGCSSCTQRGNLSYTYDAAGHRLNRTDENGNTTTYTYDANGNVLTETVPISSGVTATTTYTYNSFGEVLTVTDPLGNVTTNTYDSHGNMLTVTTPTPNGSTPASVTTFAYSSVGELLTIKDPLNNVTTLTYYATGLINTITDAQNNVTTYGYDAHGNRTSVTDALNHQTTFTYDTGDRLTKITYPDTTTMQFGYDYRGRRTTVTDQNGKVTTYAYDDADRLTSVTDAANNMTTYAYDTENNLTSVQDTNHNTTSFTYDAFGRMTKTTFPSGYIETYGYDAVGNLLNKTDRKNQQIAYAYDLMNRLTTKTYPDNTTVNYTYDKDSRLTQVADATGTYSFTFDNMGRLTGTSTQYAFLTNRTFATSYAYDAASNRTGFTDPENGATSYVYDTLNRLQTLTPPSSFTTGNFGFSYDALSRRTQMTRPNNVSTLYAYDSLSRLQSVLHQLSGSTIDGASYTLDNAGNRTAKMDQRTAVTTNYGYDNIYELLSATQGGTTTESYVYDPVGNRLTSLGVANYTNNMSNELTSTSNAAYTYDYNGNAISKTDSTGTTNYTWDFENRLTNITLPGSGGSVSFKYDPFGRRIEKISPTTTSIFAFDGDNLIEETNASGTAVARYTQGLKLDEPLALLRSGATSFYHTDGLGSVTSLSNTAGALAQTYTFDSSGNQTASSGSLTNSFRYTGREFDTESSLYFIRARYFDPTTGRFISEDPGTFRGGINFYRYAKNNPANLIDPFGLNPANPAIPWPWPIVLPFPIASPWARAIGGFLGGLVTELAWPDATGIDDARAIPKPAPIPKCDKDKDKDHCRKALEECREQCWDDDVKVPKGRGQDTFLLFRRCVRECMLAKGCENF